MAGRTYQHDIASIHSKHPELPIALGSIDINRGIHGGDIINRADLTHARAVAKGLRALQTLGEENATEDVCETAEIRTKAIEAAVYTAEYGPANLVEVLQTINNRLEQIDTRLTIMEGRLDTLDALSTRLDELKAMSTNTRIITRNRSMQGLDIDPLQKTVPGDGLAKAIPVAPTNVRLPSAATAAAQAAAIGSTPPNFVGQDLPNYSHRQFLELIIFYNETFGISPGDNLPTRYEKFRRFLTVL